MRKAECLLPYFIIAVGVSLLYSCRKGNSTYTIPEFPPTTVFDSITDMTPAYAKGFKVTYLSDGGHLTDLPLSELGGENEVRVLIGPENVAEELRDSSVIIASYDAGQGSNIQRR